MARPRRQARPRIVLTPEWAEWLEHDYSGGYGDSNGEFLDPYLIPATSTGRFSSFAEETKAQARAIWEAFAEDYAHPSHPAHGWPGFGAPAID